MALYAVFAVLAFSLLSQTSGPPAVRTRTLLACLAFGLVDVTIATYAAVNTGVAVAAMFVFGFLVSFAGGLRRPGQRGLDRAAAAVHPAVAAAVRPRVARLAAGGADPRDGPAHRHRPVPDAGPGTARLRPAVGRRDREGSGARGRHRRRLRARWAGERARARPPRRERQGGVIRDPARRGAPRRAAVRAEPDGPRADRRRRGAAGHGLPADGPAHRGRHRPAGPAGPGRRRRSRRPSPTRVRRWCGRGRSRPPTSSPPRSRRNGTCGEGAGRRARVGRGAGGAVPRRGDDPGGGPPGRRRHSGDGAGARAGYGAEVPRRTPDPTTRSGMRAGRRCRSSGTGSAGTSRCARWSSRTPCGSRPASRWPGSSPASSRCPTGCGSCWPR